MHPRYSKEIIKIRTAVNNTRARLVVFLFRAPEVLECAERRKDGATDPDRVLAFGGSNNLDLHARRRQRRQLLLHTVCNTREHGSATGEDDVAVEVTTNVKVTLEDRVVTEKQAKSVSTIDNRLQLEGAHVVSWIPEASRPKKEGWKRASGARNLQRSKLELYAPITKRSQTDRSLPMVIT